MVTISRPTFTDLTIQIIGYMSSPLYIYVNTYGNIYTKQEIFLLHLFDFQALSPLSSEPFMQDMIIRIIMIFMAKYERIANKIKLHKQMYCIIFHLELKVAKILGC